MEKRKFTKKEIIALAVLIFLMIAVVAAGAVIIINNVNNANYEATNTSHTTIALNTTAPSETVAEQGGTEKIVSAKSKTSHNSSKSTASTTATKLSTLSKTTSKSSKSSKSSSTKSKSPSSGGGEKIDVVIPATNPDHKTDDKCKINGTTCYVGDVITITLNLNVPIVLENYQGYTTYDDNYLEYVSVTPNTNGIVNNSGNRILYNASVLSGLDFTQTGTIYTAKFRVKKSGSTEIENTLQVLTDKKDKPVSFSKAKDEIAVFS
ncbi:MAG: hypothetical protein J1E41_04195 [Ruminococcus sp.]|nr:hypothetical protein [Ruminococcus sp.]